MRHTCGCCTYSNHVLRMISTSYFCFVLLCAVSINTYMYAIHCLFATRRVTRMPNAKHTKHRQ
jgi:hypothetical protein